VLTVSPEALGQEADETRLGMLPGQTFRVNELLAAMMLVSANDAANTVAVSTVGMPRFVAAMNEQVEALHLHESHFTTPVGLDDPGQYTSPYDLAVITAVAYEGHKEFRDLAGARHMILPASAAHPQHDLPNINHLLEIYPGALGVKPGYTWNAGPCLVSMVVRDNHRFLAVLMNAPNMYLQMRALVDWGYTRYGLPSLIPPPPPPPVVKVPAPLPRRKR
jgi:D-alanyl-D-alanine carboxypeptidase